MAADPITAGLDLGTKLIERLWPDPAQQTDAKLKLLELQQTGELALLGAQADIIKAEASSESWLARSWRPILMLTFGGLIVARWFGFAAPNLNQDEYMKLWDIVQFGISGYVVGRSTEKVATTVAPILQGMLKK